MKKSRPMELARPPKNKRARELWLQHAAGKIIFDNARAYALAKIDKKADRKSKVVARKAIDDAMYGLMMIFDGVSGQLQNSTHHLQLKTSVQLFKNKGKGKATKVDEIDLAQGDGMCMGFHGWLEDDFGEDAILKKK